MATSLAEVLKTLSLAFKINPSLQVLSPLVVFGSLLALLKLGPFFDWISTIGCLLKLNCIKWAFPSPLIVTYATIPGKISLTFSKSDLLF